MYKSIESREIEDLMETGLITIIDIRDPVSFEASHLKNAKHISDTNVEEFVRDANFDEKLLVYCYHGNASQSAAAYFEEQGFTDVYHLIGGFAAWQENSLPTDPE
jgi:thiosulfate sulfurtransferase